MLHSIIACYVLRNRGVLGDLSVMLVCIYIYCISPQLVDMPPAQLISGRDGFTFCHTRPAQKAKSVTQCPKSTS